TLGLRFPGLRQAGGNRAEQGNVRDAAPQLCQRGNDSQRPRFARVGDQGALLSHQPDVFRHRVKTAESKLVGDFLESRRRALRPLPFLDEIKNLLLFARQSIHTVYRYSIMRVFVVNQENGGGWGAIPGWAGFAGGVVLK